MKYAILFVLLTGLASGQDWVWLHFGTPTNDSTLTQIDCRQVQAPNGQWLQPDDLKDYLNAGNPVPPYPHGYPALVYVPGGCFVSRPSSIAAGKDACTTNPAVTLSNPTAAHRYRLVAIKTDLDQVETALDQIDVSATGTVGVAIAATTGTTKTALQEVRKTLADMKTAAKNLRQAAEKLRREIR